MEIAINAKHVLLDSTAEDISDFFAKSNVYGMTVREELKKYDIFHPKGGDEHQQNIILEFLKWKATIYYLTPLN